MEKEVNQEEFEQEQETEEITDDPSQSEEEEELSEEESEEEESGKSTEEPKKPKSAQKRINELTRKRREAEREAEYWKNKALKGEATPAEEMPPKEDELVKPKADDFDTYDEYYEALADYKAEKKVRDILKKQEEKDKQKKTANETIEAIKQFKERAEKTAEKYEDFDEVITDEETPYNEAMKQAVFNSEIGPEIAYYLGKHKEEAMKIAKMPVLKSVMEMGKLEDRLFASLKGKPKKPSNAPVPIKPIKGSGNTIAKDPNKMSMKEYRAFRQGKK